MKFKQSMIATLIVTLLGACNFNGEDGADGISGVQGQAGLMGQTGKDSSRGLQIDLIGRALLNVESPEGAAEIVAYQQAKNWLYAINSSGSNVSVEIIDINAIDAASLTKNAEGVITNTNLTSTMTIDVSSNTLGDANSIAIDDNYNVLAVAMAAKETGVAGNIAFYDISGAQPQFIKNVSVGALPDMVTFSHDGNKVLVANEGEPSGDYTIDPEGSISVITINNGVPSDTALSVDFNSFNDKKAQLTEQGVVFANPTGRTINGTIINTSVAMDLEPEYVTITKDNKTAYISLQENNAMAILDLETMEINVRGLGFKSWADHMMDASDKDGGINLRQYPSLYGMYQPDTLTSYQWQGADFIVSANEGDGREYFFAADNEVDCLTKGGLEFDVKDGCLSFTDEIRAKNLILGESFDYLNNDNNDLGRLKVTTFLGASDNSTEGNGTYDKLFTYGARSFTIWDSNGLVVFDSGDQIARITASIHGDAFNNDEDANEGDTRSDAKGAEPEALAIGQIGIQNYLFIGLERMSGILAYNITNPYNVEFVEYFINRGLAEGQQISGDLGPEGMAFISAENSPTSQALLVVGNEISGSVAVWQIAEK
jgi:hypothetical protein